MDVTEYPINACPYPIILQVASADFINYFSINGAALCLANNNDNKNDGNCYGNNDDDHTDSVDDEGSNAKGSAG